MSLTERLPSGPGVVGKPPSAFTLIEVILVIAVMLLAMTALVPLFASRSEERELKSAADALERLARSARAAAAYRGASASIRITGSGFALHVVERAVEDEADGPEGGDHAFPWANEDELPADAGRDQESAGEAEAKEQHVLGKGVVVKLRPWLATRWSQPEDYVWVFQPSGLCEPLAVRLEMGESWIELAFNPLTAQVQEESYAFP